MLISAMQRSDGVRNRKESSLAIDKHLGRISQFLVVHLRQVSVDSKQREKRLTYVNGTYQLFSSPTLGIQRSDKPMRLVVMNAQPHGK